MQTTSEEAPRAPARSRPFLVVLVLVLLAVLAVRIALSLASVAQEVLSTRDVDDAGIDVFIAAVCTSVAVPAVLFLRRRVDRRDLRSMGLSRVGPALRAALGGLAVTAGAAAVVLYPATAAGAIAWVPVDPVQLLYFLVVNAVVALLLEALPEEIAFRGYVFTTIAETGRTVLAPVLTTVLFVGMFTVGSLSDQVVRAVFGLPSQPVSLAPPGEEPVSYAILLTVFGIALVAVRAATGSLWPCVGMHLGFLSVNRSVLYGDTYDAGAGAVLLDPDAILLFLLYIVLAATVLVIVARWRRRRAPSPTTPSH